MDKKDLIVQLAKKTGSTQSSAKKFLEAFTDLIADNLTVDIEPLPLIEARDS